MAKPLDIVIYPSPILEKVSEEVKFPLDNSTTTLITDMWATLAEKGIGLAAPQVGVNKQICIIHLIADARPKGKKDLNFVMINPKIVFESQVENLMVEGCLSFRRFFYEIWRPANISVEFFNEKGKKRTLKAKEWLARVIQHEIGHLQGNLFIKMGGKKIKKDDLKGREVID